LLCLFAYFEIRVYFPLTFLVMPHPFFRFYHLYVQFICILLSNVPYRFPRHLSFVPAVTYSVSWHFLSRKSLFALVTAVFTSAYFRILFCMKVAVAILSTLINAIRCYTCVCSGQGNCFFIKAHSAVCFLHISPIMLLPNKTILHLMYVYFTAKYKINPVRYM
jgi:hypothetical protein